MKRSWLTFVSAFSVLAATLQAQTPDTVTVKLKYKPFASYEEASQLVPMYSSSAQIHNSKLKGWKIPGVAGTVTFFRLNEYGQYKGVVAALSGLKTTNKQTNFYRLWVDWNGDGRFESSETYPGVKEPNGAQMLFGPLTIPKGHNGAGERFWVISYSSYYALIRAGGMYQGEAKLDDRTVKVGVVDTSLQGLPHPARMWSSCLVAADINGDGDFMLHNTNTLSSSQVEVWQEGVNLRFDNDVYWKTAVTANGELQLTRNKTPLGTLKIGDSAVTATLNSDGMYELNSKNGEFNIPAGHYNIAQMRYSLRADDNVMWSFDMSLYEDKNNAVDITPGKTTVLKCGAPFTSEIEVSNLRKDQPYVFNIVTKDCEGHKVAGIYGPLNERPTAPELTIRQNGKVIKTATFAYG